MSRLMAEMREDETSSCSSSRETELVTLSMKKFHSAREIDASLPLSSFLNCALTFFGFVSFSSVGSSDVSRNSLIAGFCSPATSSSSVIVPLLSVSISSKIARPRFVSSTLMSALSRRSTVADWRFVNAGAPTDWRSSTWEERDGASRARRGRLHQVPSDWACIAHP